MKKRIRITILGAALIMACAFSAHTVSADDIAATSTPATNSPRLLALHLDASQHVFKLGEPITIELSVTNASSDALSVPPVTPWEAAKLIVRRNDDTIVKPSTSPVAYHWGFAGHAVLQPGQSYTYRWRQSKPPYALTFFNPISYWGYQELPPGNYTITAVPYYMASFSHKKWVKEGSDNRSNSVEIDVQP
jgi:hypothetical protein